MKEKRIYTKEDFDKWKSNKDFVMNTTMFIHNIHNKEIEILIKKKIEFANLAGEKEKSIVYSLQTCELNKIIPDLSKLSNIQGKYLNKISIISDNPIILEIEVEEIVINIDCKYLTLRSYQDITEVAKPIINKYVVKFILNEKLPLPTFWIEQLKVVGYSATFIGYFGETILLSDIPRDDYSSFSIKPLDSDKFSLGINFCKAINITNHQSEIILDLHDDTLQSFWKSLIGIVCSLNVSKIKSGNVEFHKSDFIEFKKIFEI
ncbi:MAG: hypothetical protein LBQ13_02450 [Endomicrobium sp.]|jgi:hypothetical protein|nr:hypothetical protein [Endomicrobium sp.]